MNRLKSLNDLLAVKHKYQAIHDLAEELDIPVERGTVFPGGIGWDEDLNEFLRELKTDIVDEVTCKCNHWDGYVVLLSKEDDLKCKAYFKYVYRHEDCEETFIDFDTIEKF